MHAVKYQQLIGDVLVIGLSSLSLKKRITKHGRGRQTKLYLAVHKHDFFSKKNKMLLTHSAGLEHETLELGFNICKSKSKVD